MTPTGIGRGTGPARWEARAVPTDQSERYLGHDGHARVSPAFARRVLTRIHGMTVPDALHALRFTAAFSCPQVARIVQIAVAKAAHRGHPADALLVGDGSVSDGEDVIRVRRQAHGMADWITTRTTAITVEVHPADRPTPADSTVDSADPPCEEPHR